MNIYFHKNFEKKFGKLKFGIKNKFKERKNLFLENPFSPLLNNHPLTGNRKGQWSISISGDFRAIYHFLDKDVVIFIDIDTHSNLYR